MKKGQLRIPILMTPFKQNLYFEYFPNYIERIVRYGMKNLTFKYQRNFIINILVSSSNSKYS